MAGWYQENRLRGTINALAGGSQAVYCFNRLLATEVVYPMYHRLSRYAKKMGGPRIFAISRAYRPGLPAWEAGNPGVFG